MRVCVTKLVRNAVGGPSLVPQGQDRGALILGQRHSSSMVVTLPPPPGPRTHVPPARVQTWADSPTTHVYSRPVARTLSIRLVEARGHATPRFRQHAALARRTSSASPATLES